MLVGTILSLEWPIAFGLILFFLPLGLILLFYFLDPLDLKNQLSGIADSIYSPSHGLFNADQREGMWTLRL